MRLRRFVSLMGSPVGALRLHRELVGALPTQPGLRLGPGQTGETREVGDGLAALAGAARARFSLGPHVSSAELTNDAVRLRVDYL